LTAVKGVGVDTAGALLAAAGDDPGRLHSESAFAYLCSVAPIPAPSGKTDRLLRPAGARLVIVARWAGEQMGSSGWLPAALNGSGYGFDSCARSRARAVGLRGAHAEGVPTVILPRVRDPRFVTIRRGGTLTSRSTGIDHGAPSTSMAALIAHPDLGGR
jgi:hypothetical protein